MNEDRLTQIRTAIEGNDWWRLASGDHLNMAEELLNAYDAQIERNASLTAAVDATLAVNDHLADELSACMAVRKAALALVVHWDDPHGGEDDGIFDAERWEHERLVRETALRVALEPIGPAVTDPDRSPRNREAAGW